MIFKEKFLTNLSVNLNKIAVLRNQRDMNIPNLLWAAKTAISAGAYGITVHPRPDERHIRYNDVYDLRKLLDSGYSGIEYNIEGNPLEGKFMQLMTDILPDQATLVPDSIYQKTSDHGWDLTIQDNFDKVAPIVEKLKKLNIRVSIFTDADEEKVQAAAKIGTDRIELYTEPYARAFEKGGDELEKSLKLYSHAADAATGLGLEINAGHDLNLDNLGLFCKRVNNVLEVSIGHALTADALNYGLFDTVKKYLEILENLGA